MLIDQERRKLYVFAGQRGSKEYLRYVLIVNLNIFKKKKIFFKSTLYLV